MEGISEYFQVSREEIEALLRQMPLTAGVPEMLKRLKDLDAVFIIVSDANAVFIGEPLATTFWLRTLPCWSDICPSTSST